MTSQRLKRLVRLAIDQRFTKFSNSYLDNLSPQETTTQAVPDMGPDGGDLSCPGSSVVANPDDFDV